VLYANEPAYVQSFGKNEWDIAILGRDALHANNDVTPDFMLADALYIAAPGREFVDAGQIDRPGVNVGVVRGGIAEKRLEQVLKSAELVRVSPGVNSAIETLRSDKADVWASNPGSHAGDPRWAARGEDRARGVCDGSVCGGTPERTIV